MKNIKRLVAMLINSAMLLSIIAIVPFSASADETNSVYEYDGYTVDYEITNSWGDGQYNNVTVSIENTGTETIENWMLAYDFMGEASMQSGGEIFQTENGTTYVKNTGNNLTGFGDSLNIDPGNSVNFSYSLINPTGTPDNFTLCQERADVDNSNFEVVLTPQYDYGNSFQGEISLTNLTDTPIESWELTFSSNNFTLQNSWDRTLINHGDGKYTIKPLAGGIIRVNPNSTLTFGFQADKTSDVTFENLNFNVEGLTAVVFDETIEDIPEIPDIPENPENPDTPELPEIPSDLDVLVAFGVFNEEENAITLNWAYQDNTGNFSIFETTNEKTLLAEVTDNTEYSFAVDNSIEKYTFVVEKYISDNENIISNEVVMQLNENGQYEFVYVDSDGDSLPDVYEHILGTNPDIPDTDSDDLPDGYEVTVLETSPLLPDTDDNGISDADEDFDNDTLSNFQEYEIQTDPFEPDTDDDTISDNEEISLGTDPLVPDSDIDGLLDGEEGYTSTIYTKYGVYFDPINPDTDDNGILDGDERFAQNVQKEVVTSDGAITNISVEMITNGNLDENLTIESMMDKDWMSSNVVGLVGEPFDFKTPSEFDNTTITFTIDQTKLGETEFEDLLFLWYDKENDNFQEFETSYDEENSTVSTETTHFSHYMVVDARIWYAVWTNNPYVNMGENNLPNQPNAIGISQTLPTSKSAALALSKTFGDSNYLLIETSNLTWEQAEEYCESYGGHLATITSAAENDFVFNLINQGSKTWYWIGGKWDAYRSPTWITGENFNQNVVTFRDTWGVDFSGNLGGYRSSSGYDSGVWYKGRIIQDIGNYVPLSLVCEWDKEIKLVDSDEDKLPDAYENAGLILSNGDFIRTNPNNKHSDFDKLEDGVEINPEIVKQYIYKDIYKIHFKMRSNPKAEDSDGDDVWDDEELIYYSSTQELIYHSYPTEPDSDIDGINDYYDTSPLTYNDGDIYNRQAVVEYAVYWGGKDIVNGEEVGRYNPDFEKFASDCTNFASQCLNAGGYKMTGDWFHTKEKKLNGVTRLIIDTLLFPYEQQRSKNYLWTNNFVVCEELYAYIKDNYYCYKSETVIKNKEDIIECSRNVKEGDLIFFGANKTDHAVVVTKVTENEIFYSGHTEHRVNEPLSKHLGQSITIVHMKNELRKGIDYD
ncbi:MAG: amidase domain-containing protein [Oscillospiraceae bacterium]|jgi:hypothetical protein|nr:amidase domain-containing protein [Oscillospiraceae bacterium]